MREAREHDACLPLMNLAAGRVRLSPDPLISPRCADLMLVIFGRPRRLVSVLLVG